MKNRKLLAVFALALAALLMLGACAAEKAYDASSQTGGYYSDFCYDNGGPAPDTPMAPPMADEAYRGEGGKEMNMPGSSLAPTGGLHQNVKLIYIANISVQTTNFQETYDNLLKLVEENGAYFESSSVDNGSYYSDGVRTYGYYTIRVPAENYGNFVNAVGGCCHVVSLNENVKDVGLEYFEIESRLETLRIKEQRLHDLLREASTMSDIIDLENALAETEYQIDSYTSSLNRYDSLIGYSTINISIETVAIYTPSVTEELTFGERVSKAFERGVANFQYGFEDFVVWGSENVLHILFWLAVILIVWAIHPIRRMRAGNIKWQQRHEARLRAKADRLAAKAAKKHAKKNPVPPKESSADKASDEGDGWSQPAFTQQEASEEVPDK